MRETGWVAMARQHGETVRNLLAAALALFCAPLWAQDTLPDRKPSPLTVRQIHSGHSLTDSYGSNPWPGRLILATETQPGTRPRDTIARSVIPGSPLRWRWNNASRSPDARQDIADYELLVTTEAVPLRTGRLDGSIGWLNRWVEHAWTRGNGGRGAEVMLYSTWVHWRRGKDEDDPDRDLPFRDRMDRQGAAWERMQDEANAARPSGMPPIYMIPGHVLMMRIDADITAGRAPGLGSIGDIFGDSIHLNDIGKYAVTCLVYAVIYQRDPRELPDRLSDEDSLSPAQARYFKALAWEVATSYDRAGVPGG
jgi:hypothetical protein